MTQGWRGRTGPWLRAGVGIVLIASVGCLNPDKAKRDPIKPLPKLPLPTNTSSVTPRPINPAPTALPTNRMQPIVNRPRTAEPASRAVGDQFPATSGMGVGLINPPTLPSSTGEIRTSAISPPMPPAALGSLTPPGSIGGGGGAGVPLPPQPGFGAAIPPLPANPNPPIAATPSVDGMSQIFPATPPALPPATTQPVSGDATGLVNRSNGPVPPPSLP